MRWYRKLHWKIIVGLVLGLLYGILAAGVGWSQFTNDWISPFGTVFINLLKLIAVPLVLASLITGVASLSDLRKLSRIGGKTIAIYVGTTAVAVSIGLVVVNLLRPGENLPAGMRQQLQEVYKGDVTQRAEEAELARQRGPLQPFVDMIPDNFFGSAASNRNMLQVVFVAILVGIGLIQVPRETAKPLLSFFESLNHVVIRLVDVIMLMAPVGVFALIAGTITTVARDNPAQVLALLGALGTYCLAVVLGLVIHMVLTYALLLKFFTPMSAKTFYSGIAPAQLVAFSTSSSGATLPVTMERCEEKLGVSEEVSSFVLPLGATINMDGTALYQAVAAVFIAQSLGMGLGLSAQLTIVLTAVLASIGTAAVPGAGIIMLVIILEAIGVPSAGIALILGVDRILDMLRTVTNITGDATVASVVAASEGQLQAPNLSENSDRVDVVAAD
ncbi:MAG: dicarboxylate/amino acid:cation symporter [Acidobacteriota bacterium]